MAELIFTPELAQELLDSDETFVVNFEDAWKWIGYPTKNAAKNELISSFDQGLDFLITTEYSLSLFHAIRDQHPLFANFVLIHSPNESEDRKVGTEQTIQKRLLDYFGSNASKEVPAPSGRIDVLTPDYLIEIKSGYAWRSALGQLLAYSTAYPDHQKVLYLFELDYRMESVVYDTCRLENIDVWLHFDWDKKLPRYIPSESKKKSNTYSQPILLTTNCFKQLAMMAGTDAGKQIERYFLECEQVTATEDPILAQLKMLTQMREQQLDQEHRIAQLEEVRAIELFGQEAAS